MGYLEDFKTQINNRNFPKFLQLWEEYCTSDDVEADEFSQLLIAIKNSDFAKSFGKIVETAIPLWQTLKDKNESYQILSLLIDSQTTNSPVLADLALNAIKERYGDQTQFNERLRLVGLRSRENFQGALSSYDLLSHMEKGKFVFHNGGWGAGEIIELSPIRQQITIEFENVAGRKHVTFDNAFKTLTPLPDSHFLVRRFADPDALEKEARDEPVAIVKMLLKDLGPKTASEIKDDLCELVIPEKDWTKWWQAARTKLKKDMMIESPATTRDLFKLRKSAITQEERLKKAIQHKTNIDEIIQTSYNFLRDLPNVQKNQEVRNSLKTKILQQLQDPQLTPSQELQIYMLLENQYGQVEEGKTLSKLINHADIESIIEDIEIIALKKRALALAKEHRKDWEGIFLNMFLTLSHSTIREYLLKELSKNGTKGALEKVLKNLLQNPETYPDCFLWYFQQLMSDDHETIPYSGKEGQCQFFEAFLILLSKLENKPNYRDLTKKMYTLLSGKRYALVRSIMEGSSEEYIKESLLLAAKCQILTDHDRKILRSLAAVVHPSLGEPKSRNKGDVNTIWATEEGLLRTQEEVRQLGTVQVIENAREIEAARALGDLRENAEFKSARERRVRLLSQLKTLSDQLQHSRLITKDDILTDEVSVGSVVEVIDGQGKKTVYTILGPWEANAEKNILSFQSKLAQAMLGCKPGDSLRFRDDDIKITSIKSYLDK